MRTVQGDADTFLVWQAKSSPSTLVTMHHGLGWPGRSETGASLVQPASYVEVGKEIVFVTDLIVEPDITVAPNAKFDFQVNGGITGQTVVLLNWGDTLVTRELGLYGHLKYSRFVLTAVDVLLPERFYDISGVRPEDPAWGVAPGTDPVGAGENFSFACSIDIGFLSTPVPSSNNYIQSDPPEYVWRFGVDVGAPFIGSDNSRHGCAQGTSYLPAVVGFTFENVERICRGNLIALQMFNRSTDDGSASSVTVPSAVSKLWRLRVVLRGYVA